MRSKGKFFSGVGRLARNLAGDETGSPAVEFALVFPIFIAVVLATLQAASIFLVKAFFESAAEEAARVVLTNQTETLTAAQFQTFYPEWQRFARFRDPLLTSSFWERVTDSTGA